ncbi:FixH family protein [Cytobacillus firmus]|uniref:FixH family protein n=1 Tax=Cytobacillus TaxID=2675230 RepID=UPI00254CEE1B|nr:MULTISPECIES: FixH family protein [Cytobacillus]MDK7669360.1 FixH family protein [Cytobacillus oceanisediminis]MED4770679.1 FixH family protein [Cytobacillus firmus]
MRKAIILFVCVLFLLLGCSKENEAAEEVPELLEVSVNFPEVIQANQEVVIEAAVTQGQEKVEDANEVKFEVKKAGQDTSEEMIAEHQGKGVYSITTTFQEAGTYSVTAHVTARGMHNMPTKEFKVE